MQHGTLDQERRLLPPLVGTSQLEEFIRYFITTIDTRRLTSIHSIGSQQLVSILDGLRHVNAAIRECINSVPLVQIGAVSVQRQVVILVVMSDTIELLYEWDTGSL
jgi:hypothetical protein